jgi:hypothetical protein
MRKIILFLLLFSLFSVSLFGQITRPAPPFAGFNTALQIASLACFKTGTLVWDATNLQYKVCTATGTPGTWAAVGGSGGSAAIGGAITGATTGSVLFANSSAQFAQLNNRFKFDSTAETLYLGDTSYLGNTVGASAASGWSTSKAFLKVGFDTALANSTQHVYGAQFDMKRAMSSGSFQTSGIRPRCWIQASGTASNPICTGVESFVDNTGSTVETDLQAVEGITQSTVAAQWIVGGWFQSTASANLSFANWGVRSAIGQSGGTSGTNVVYEGVANTSGAGAMTNLYGLRFAGWSGSNITNSYGIYADSSIDRGSTLKYFIFYSGVSPSSFGGAVTINSPTASTVPFTVKLAATPSGNAFEVNSSSGSGGDLFKIASTGDVKFFNIIQAQNGNSSILRSAAGGGSVIIQNAFLETGLSYGDNRRVELGAVALGNGRPAQITSNKNDYDPGANATTIYLNADAARNITGFVSSLGTGTTNSAGQYHLLINNGTFNITLTNEDSASTAANRFTNSTNADYVLLPKQSVGIYYDGTALRWRVFGSAGYLWDSRVSGSNVTSSSITPANITGLSATVAAGRTYTGEIVLYYNQSVSADGFRFDLDGGTATATNFRSTAVISDSVSSRFLGMNTAIATDYTDTTTTGNAQVRISFTCTVNAAGTLIPRVALEAFSTGVGTVYVGSYMTVKDMN